MSGMAEFFGDNRKIGDSVIATEKLVLQVQTEIQRTLNEKKLTQKELAARLNVSPASVSQMMADRGANLTLKTIARIFHALNERVTIERSNKPPTRLKKKQIKDQLLFVAASLPEHRAGWTQPASNDNEMPRALVA